MALNAAEDTAITSFPLDLEVLNNVRTNKMKRTYRSTVQRTHRDRFQHLQNLEKIFYHGL